MKTQKKITKNKISKFKSFTLIEILVVATIIALLASGGVVVYTQLNRASRDAKRKTDLEQIRAALEMYRSNNGIYPVNLSILTTPAPQQPYLNTIPTDPKSPTYTYYYTPLPVGCSNNCNDYTLAAHLETISTTCQRLSNQCTSNCTYCLGPYGQK
jgi:prepilin-type N-terminal cleavage/methylation domain